MTSVSIDGAIAPAGNALVERIGANPDAHPAETDAITFDWVLGTGGISIAMLLFVSAAIFLGVTLSALRQIIALAEQSEQSLLQISNVRESLFDAGSSARGFVTDHDKQFLVEYRRARVRIGTSLGGLTVQVAKEPNATHQVQVLRPMIARRLAILDQMIAAASNPATKSLVSANDKERMRLTRLINAQVSRIRAEEQAVLSVRQGAATKAANFAIWLSLVTAIAAPICGASGIYLRQRERERHQARELEIEMMHAQRLAIMGETASMLAHEIRQPLSAAKNYLGALRRIEAPSGPGGEVHEIADKANDQISRANSIVQRLRSFIEKRDDERVAERVEDLIADAVALLGTLDAGIVLDTRIVPNLPEPLVDRIQIQQVLVNLMRNAIEAMRGASRRELHLSAAAFDADAVLISLEDTGPGLPADIAANLFKPFVTTKEGGMGVGLSICRSIIAAHGGRIWAEKAPSGGAIFRFTLHAVRDEDVG